VGPTLLPLYAQVKAQLIERIQSGDWKPGELIPNEFVLAKDLGVSQGTVRKALGEMTAEKLLLRRQGRGTFVAQHTPESTMFRFFNFYDENGGHVAPETIWVRSRSGVAKPGERLKLWLESGDRVVRISRLRGRDGRPFAYEEICVPEALFPGLADCEIPNTLYDHFQRNYGVTVTGGEEKLTAVAAPEQQAGHLDVAVGAPLLQLDRQTFSLDGRPVEWRLSLCALANAHYLVRLG
jgi:GntR family transcriptional regulator